MIRRLIEAAVVVPLVTLLVAFWHRRLLVGPEDWTAGAWRLSPSDGAGTHWFYWWVGEAARQGVPVGWSTMTCLPGGQPLENNHPNRIDALLAQPFLDAWGPATGFDLFVLAIFVAGVLATYLCVRQWVERPWVALPLAASAGLSSYGVFEVWQGRPVSALFALVPLVLAAWAVGLRARRWPVALGAGVVGAALLSLQAWLYIPYAFVLAVLLTGWALVAAARPAAHGHRVRALWLLLAVGAGSLVLTLPYLHEVLVLRPRGGSGLDARVVFAPVQLLRELGATRDGLGAGVGFGGAPQVPAYFDGPYWIAVQGESMAVDWLWAPASGRSHRPVALSSVLVLAGVLGGLLHRRSRPAALLAFAAWTLTLGPNLAWHTVRAGAELLMPGGLRVALPISGLLALLPELDVYLRPYRFVPFVGLAAAVALGQLAEGLAERLRAGGRPAWPVLGAGVALGLAALWQSAHLPLSGVPLSRVPDHPVIDMLRALPDDAVVAELPAGAGHALGPLQALHGKGRTDGLHDVPGDRGGAPPRACYRTDFTEALWYLGRSDADAQQAVAQGLSPDALDAARADGIAVVVLYPGLYRSLPRHDLDAVRARLVEALGPPVLDRPDAQVWSLGPGTPGGP